MLIRLASFLLLVLVTVPSEAQAPNRIESFTSGGKRIQVEVFAPTSAGKHPAVMLLYGAGGLTRRGNNFRRYATRLAEHGFEAFLVHYFDATNSEQAGEINSERFPLWWKAVYDGVGFAAASGWCGQEPYRSSRFFAGRIRCTSRSLARRTREGRCGVLRGYVGRLPTEGHTYASDSDPAWRQDSVIPVSQAYDLHKFLRKLGVSSELRVYPGQEHGFDSDGDPAAANDAWQRMLAFFDRYLGQ